MLSSRRLSTWIAHSASAGLLQMLHSRPSGSCTTHTEKVSPSSTAETRPEDAKIRCSKLLEVMVWELLS